MDNHPYLALVLQHLLPIVASLLTIVLFPLIRALFKKLDAKYDLHLSSLANEQTNDLLRRGIAYAEEWARNKVKVDPTKVPTGAEKLDKAIKFVEDELKNLGLVDYAKDRLEAQLHAVLGLTRPELEVKK